MSKIRGVACSEAIDSSGEILELAGADISSLLEGKGFLSWEHESTEESPENVIGKVTYVKKIFSEKDCDTPIQLQYFEMCKKIPYLYLEGEMFDDAGHPGAECIKALMRYAKSKNEPMEIGFSIEGQTLQRDGHRLVKTVLRGCTTTLKSCNKQAFAQLIDENPQFKKSQGNDKFQPLAKGLTINAADCYSEDYNPSDAIYSLQSFTQLAKALSADMPTAAPGANVGGAALAASEEEPKKKKLKKDVLPQNTKTVEAPMDPKTLAFELPKESDKGFKPQPGDWEEGIPAAQDYFNHLKMKGLGLLPQQPRLSDKGFKPDPEHGGYETGLPASEEFSRFHQDKPIKLAMSEGLIADKILNSKFSQHQHPEVFNVKARLMAALRNREPHQSAQEVIKSALQDLGPSFVDHFDKMIGDLQLKKSDGVASHRSTAAHIPHTKLQKLLVAGVRVGSPDSRSKMTVNSMGDRVMVRQAHNEPGDALNTSERATIYHNLSHDLFGLGHHVPQTSCYVSPKDHHMYHCTHFKDGLSHGHELKKQSEYDAAVSSNPERLHKLALMDYVMGHEGRDLSNTKSDGQGHIWLTDNEKAFGQNPVKPEYLQYREKHPVDIDTQEWLQHIDPRKAFKLGIVHGLPKQKAREMANRLIHAKVKLAQRGMLDDLWD